MTKTDNNTPVQPWDFDRVFRLGLMIAGVVALIWLLRFLSDVLIPFAVALLLAYLLDPVVEAIASRLGGRRGPAVIITVSGAFLVCSALLLLLIPITVREFYTFGGQVQQLGFVQQWNQSQPIMDQVQDGQESVAQAYRKFRERQSPWLQDILDDAVVRLSDELSAERMTGLLKEIAKRVAPGLLGLLSGAVSFLLGLTVIIVVLLYLIFILLDYERVTRHWPNLLPPAYKAPILQFMEEFSLAMRRYFRGQFLVASVVGILFAVGFKLIGLRMGILLGLFVGLLNMVPYLQLVGLVPALLLGVFRALEHGSGIFGSLVLVLLVFAVVQTIQDLIIMPRIMGKVTGLRPVAILLGVFVWGKLFGFLGLVLAIPLTCLGGAYYSRCVLGKLDAKVIEEQ
ncbi:MAG: AI-2E family transporter [Phycisphaerae bacterium]|nr:AI-2E family transporter [Phycisphaerae bacterium]